ncbi:conserved hypothetical protein [Latilactobacillus fuchuensis]|uniref:Uncharacterized protein n=1 Tax=Latilactobacillus fuchuensis TaxID=164393 RepID=A0A2N9DUF1_9LACO|nr:conserved hypothetical protein [Latilactobacillus fuchuensis]
MSFDVTKLSDQNLKRWFQANREPIIVTLRHPTTWLTKLNQLLIHFFE